MTDNPKMKSTSFKFLPFSSQQPIDFRKILDVDISKLELETNVNKMKQYEDMLAYQSFKKGEISTSPHLETGARNMQHALQYIKYCQDVLQEQTKYYKIVLHRLEEKERILQQCVKGKVREKKILEKETREIDRIINSHLTLLENVNPGLHNRVVVHDDGRIEVKKRMKKVDKKKQTKETEIQTDVISIQENVKEIKKEMVIDTPSDSVCVSNVDIDPMKTLLRISRAPPRPPSHPPPPGSVSHPPPRKPPPSNARMKSAQDIIKETKAVDENIASAYESNVTPMLENMVKDKDIRVETLREKLDISSDGALIHSKQDDVAIEMIDKTSLRCLEGNSDPEIKVEKIIQLSEVKPRPLTSTVIKVVQQTNKDTPDAVVMPLVTTDEVAQQIRLEDNNDSTKGNVIDVSFQTVIEVDNGEVILSHKEYREGEDNTTKDTDIMNQDLGGKEAQQESIIIKTAGDESIKETEINPLQEASSVSPDADMPHCRNEYQPSLDINNSSLDGTPSMVLSHHVEISGDEVSPVNLDRLNVEESKMEQEQKYNEMKLTDVSVLSNVSTDANVRNMSSNSLPAVLDGTGSKQSDLLLQRASSPPLDNIDIPDLNYRSEERKLSGSTEMVGSQSTSDGKEEGRSNKNEFSSTINVNEGKIDNTESSLLADSLGPPIDHSLRTSLFSVSNDNADINSTPSLGRGLANLTGEVTDISPVKHEDDVLGGTRDSLHDYTAMIQPSHEDMRDLSPSTDARDDETQLTVSMIESTDFTFVEKPVYKMERHSRSELVDKSSLVTNPSPDIDKAVGDVTFNGSPRDSLDADVLIGGMGNTIGSDIAKVIRMGTKSSGAGSANKKETLAATVNYATSDEEEEEGAVCDVSDQPLSDSFTTMKGEEERSGEASDIRSDELSFSLDAKGKEGDDEEIAIALSQITVEKSYINKVGTSLKAQCSFLDELHETEFVRINLKSGIVTWNLVKKISLREGTALMTMFARNIREIGESALIIHINVYSDTHSSSIGTSEISFGDLLDSGHDVIHKEAVVYSTEPSCEVIGTLRYSLLGFETISFIWNEFSV